MSSYHNTIYRYLLLVLIPLISITACSSDDTPPGSDDYRLSPGERGLFLMNEGNFTRGNGSISFFSVDSNRIVNDIFLAANNRSPGDVPFSMLVRGDTSYIVVNNSGKIEVVSTYSMRTIKSVTGLNSPRYIVPVDDNRAYISSLYSNEIMVIDLVTLAITDTLSIGMTSEQIVVVDDKAFIASWSGNNIVTVVDIPSGEVIDTIETGIEPESMVLDIDDMIWVLCSGGFMHQEGGRLLRIDPASLQVVESIGFAQGSYPTSLRISGCGKHLYYLDGAVYSISVREPALPDNSLIDNGERLFYRIEPDTDNGYIFVSDAVDYQRRGSLLRYSLTGTFIDKHSAGIIPGNMIIHGK